jgi:hypothetical protein
MRVALAAACFIVISLAGNGCGGGKSMRERVGTSSSSSSGRVAFDGVNYFVVWAAGRKRESRIYGARVTQSGKVLDRPAIRISSRRSGEVSPRIAFDGTNYFVVWTHQRGGGAFGREDVYGARVSRTGTVVDRTSIPIATGGGSQAGPEIAFDGANFLVVWSDASPRNRDVFDIYGARVSMAGVVLDPGGFEISREARAQTNPAVAFDGSDYLVAWSDYRSGVGYDIFAARVTPSARVLDPSGLRISKDGQVGLWGPSISAGDRDSLIAWTYLSLKDENSGWDIAAARVSRSGNVLDPGVMQIASGREESESSVSSDGTNYLVVWGETDDEKVRIKSRRVNAKGEMLGVVGREVAGADGFGPQTTGCWCRSGFGVRFGATEYLATWAEEVPPGSGRISGVRVDQDGNIVDQPSIMISESASG